MRRLVETPSVAISWNSGRFYDTFRSRDHALNFFEATIMSVYITNDHEEMFESLDKSCYYNRNVTTSILQLQDS